MSCGICGRDGRGYGYQLPNQVPPAPKRRACSMHCLDILYRERGNVLSLTHFEEEAVSAASDAAGEYLEMVGKTDLATMTSDEWTELIKLVFVRACATVQRLTDEGAVPF